MRILQVLLSPRIGGAESAASALAEAWKSAGVHCDLAYVDGDEPRNQVQRVHELRKHVRRSAPDAIVSHSAIPNIYARLSSSGRPVFCVLHSATRDFDDRKLRAAERLLARRTTAVIAVSQEQRREYLSHFPRQRVVVIPNGISAGFTPSLRYDPDAPIVTVGRVAGQKNPALWAATARTICNEDSAATFEWYGPTSVEQEWAGLVGDHSDPEGRIVFRGPTAHVADVLRTASIFFHPARREAHSVAILEAAATGLPIVCSADVAATLPDWLPRSTFEAGHADQAITALREVKTNLAAWRDRALLAVPRVQQVFSLSQTAQNYLDEIDSYIG